MQIRRRRHLHRAGVLIALLLLALTGCGIGPDRSKPTGTFDIALTEGDRAAVLRWEIKGRRCEIDQRIGLVPCTGSADVPAEPIVTYTLVAENRYGTQRFYARLGSRVGQ